MEVLIYWEKDNNSPLKDKIDITLEELWLSDFIKVIITNDKKVKEELNITKEPALIIHEESIDFKDTMFEWIIPNEEELKSMFISIVWWSDSGWSWCGPSDCWTCSSWC